MQKNLTRLVVPGLIHKHWTKLSILAADKQSSLLQKSVNYGQKSFITLAPDRNTNAGQMGILIF